MIRIDENKVAVSCSNDISEQKIYILSVQDPYDYGFENQWKVELVSTKLESIEDRKKWLESIGTKSIKIDEYIDDYYRIKTTYYNVKKC